MGPLEIIAGTADAAFATDQDRRIVVWNRAAERLLGHAAADVLGRSCHKILRGLDVFGNRFCSQGCTLTCMTQNGEPLHRFEMDLRKANGEEFRAAFSLVVVPGPKPGRFSLIHIFRPASRGPEVGSLLRRLLGGSSAPEVPTLPLPAGDPAPGSSPLTARELEVLRLLARGTGTEEIADTLFISKATVRTHIQNILRKLEVHSKLEAVSLALRRCLL